MKGHDYTNTMSSLYQRYTNAMQTLCEHYANAMRTLCKRYANTMQTLCKRYARSDNSKTLIQRAQYLILPCLFIATLA